jgi:internalin A
MKPELIIELEKELNCTFKLVDLEENIIYNYGKTPEYSIDENGNITGITITSFELKEIPKTLTKCNTLSMLNLFYNQIVDISPLKELTNIQRLLLERNQINDISPLKELKNIQVLRLYKNKISDISPLKELTTIQELYLWENQINDITLLKELKNLVILMLN